MLNKVKNYIKKNHMLQKGDKILLGFSGGADSMCLFHFLNECKDEMGISLYAVHVHHGLRGAAADEDLEFVKKQCKENNVLFQAFCCNIKEIAKEKKQTVEEAGREYRYECFAKKAKEWNCNKIAVAHHGNDVAETMLFHMIRGTGLEGMTGIKPVSGKIIRPLLCVTKSEILDYVHENHLPFQEDLTNYETEYSRNKIRQQIIPLFERINEKAILHMMEFSDDMKECSDYMQKQVQMIYENIVKCINAEDGKCTRAVVSVQELKNLEVPIQKQLIQKMLVQIAGRKKDITRQHILAVLELAEKETGKKINLPYQMTAVKNYDELILMTDVGTQQLCEQEVVLKIGENRCPNGTGSLYLEKIPYMGEEILKKKYTKYMDCDKIKHDLCLRTRRSGDFILLGDQGHKKMLKRFFIDAKIPREERERILLVAEGSHVLWIVGYRISDGIKVQEDTKSVWKLCWKAEESN